MSTKMEIEGDASYYWGTIIPLLAQSFGINFGHKT